MELIEELLIEYGVQPGIADSLSIWVMVLLIAGLSVIANYVAKKIVLRVLTHYITHNKVTWDNVLLERKVFQRLSHLVPALIIYYFASSFPGYESLIEKGAVTYMMIIAIVVLDAFLNAVNDIYRTFEVSKVRPIRGYIQVLKIFIFLIGGILVIANLVGESPLFFLSGIGALSAVLLLIFRDSLLGLVAGIQLASNDMVRVGDWIEMPKFGANGDVIDISLNTVKIENFDKTITTIPSYALISDSFINWRGMQTSGGRRIMRSIHIDTSSITFCTEDMLERFKAVHYLTDYITSKEQEIEAYNTEHQVDPSNPVNGRRLTNIGVFRMYIQNYLKHHPKIHQGMTLMVRQLAPCEHGLPIQIYAFTNDIIWEHYEAVQSDIFDHILAVAPSFELRLFQNPTGHDLHGLNRMNQPSS